MLKYSLKDVTKEIDLVCRDTAGKTRLLESGQELGVRGVLIEEEACSPGPEQGGHQGRAPLGHLCRPDLLRL